jgi:hypothetical protein
MGCCFIERHLSASLALTLNLSDSYKRGLRMSPIVFWRKPACLPEVTTHRAGVIGTMLE